MVSKPDFDPNTVAENWDFLNTDQDSVLLNRATQGQYCLLYTSMLTGLLIGIVSNEMLKRLVNIQL